MVKITMNILINILIAYLCLTALVYYLSDFAIFPSPASSYSDNMPPSPIIKLITQDGKKISAIYLKNPQAKYTLLVSHGNGEDLGSIFKMLSNFQKHDFSVFAYDYHGYGTSEGRPSEQNTYYDIEAAYAYLRNTLKIPAENIILYGRSLGSAPSIQLANEVPIAALIIESPMLTAFRAITQIPIFPVDKFRNNAKIASVKVPILVIHGTNDKIIPFWQGRKLYELSDSQKTFIPITGAGHNDVMAKGKEPYWQAIATFVSTLPSQPNNNNVESKN